jgi:hypothetical protein
MSPRERYPRSVAVVRTGRGMVVLAIACTLATLAAGVAAAGDDHGAGGRHHFGLRAFETAELGPEHAAEHAWLRRAQRYAGYSLPPEPPRETAASTAAKTGPRVSAARSAMAPEVGKWTTAPFPIPNWAIHAAMLPTGKVLFWSLIRPDKDAAGRAALWDPSLGTGPDSLTVVNPPLIDVDGDGDLERAPIFCSGLSMLADGNVLVTGGILRGDPGVPHDSPTGHDRVFTFDPWTETWTEQPQMEAGRYYPSQVELADGRTAIVSGLTEEAPGGIPNDRLELYVPDDGDADSLGSIERVPSGDRQTHNYPHLFELPSGDVLLAGPGQDDTGLLSTDSFTWTNLPQLGQDRIYSSAVLDPEGPQGSSKVTVIGGFERDPYDPSGYANGVASTETIDASQPDPQWQPGAAMNVGRAYQNTVLLPDGSMVTVGGGLGERPALGNYAAVRKDKRVELYDPGTDTWRLGPAEQEFRTYHSTALLLPDGRVWSAGDDGNPLGPNGERSTSDTAEIYSPPYLFAGSRPRIKQAPSQLGYADTFQVRTRDASEQQAVLIAPGATTHAVDMNQRMVPLALDQVVAGVGPKLVSPPNPKVAPPGYYMLFVLNDSGVPSKAAWVHLSP